ncbi:protein sneaky-like [Convolutriloba macropyga]|uniref:protein sneaky-like n=1 Tax=Convolutriloba macropyga TaxID=536237 RepID=UPI003F520C70
MELENPFEHIADSLKKQFGGLKESFGTFRLIVGALIYCVQMFHIWTFAMLVRRLWIYVRKYNVNIEFDNKYLEDYFLRIEKRRQRDKEMCLFPLRANEKQRLLSITRLLPTKDECSKLFETGLFTLLRHVAYFSVFGFDQLMTRVLFMTSRALYLDAKLEAWEKVETSVIGDGIMAKILRKLSSLFESNNKLSQQISTLKCLPELSFTDGNFFKFFAVMVVCQWILHYTRIFVTRSFHLIAALYYYRRGKDRTLHLYNSFLKERVRKFETCKTTLLLQLCHKTDQNTIPIDVLNYVATKCLLRRKQKKPNRKSSINIKDCDFCGEKRNRVHKTCLVCDFTLCQVCYELSLGACVKCKIVKTLRETGNGQCQVCDRFLTGDEELLTCKLKADNNSDNVIRVCNLCSDDKQSSHH